MHVNFAGKGIIQIDDARIIYRNFSGTPSQYNRAGDRNFAVVIPDADIADALINEGWNVTIKQPREEGDAPFMYLKVKVKFNESGTSPRVYLKTGKNLNKLDEESIACLDQVDIACVDLDLRPYDWDINGKTGRTAYLQSICVTQEIDRFAAQFAEEEAPEEVPF